MAAYSPPLDPAKRIAFLAGQLTVPNDFDSLGQDEIQAMLEGEE